MLKVVICDDHPVCREGLKKAFSQTSDIRVVAEASTGPELRARVQDTPCDAVILDVSLPGASGLDVLEELSRRSPAVPVLVLSMYAADEYAVSALRHGAAGYVPKDRPISEVIAAVRKVASGGKYVGVDQAELLAEEVGRHKRRKREGFSGRELQVMQGLASGLGIREIAQRLRISPSTIGTHRARILGKLGLRTTTELIRYALEHGLLEGPGGPTQGPG